MLRSHSGRQRSAFRGVRLAALLAVAVPMLAGCSVDTAPRFGWPRGITQQGDRMLSLWSASSIAALVVGVFVWGLIFWAVLRYRGRTGDESMPAQVGYSLPIEVLYTVVPFLIISVLFYYTAVDQTFVNKESAKPDVQVSVLAFKWNWQFGYVDKRDKTGQFVQTVGSSTEVPILVLPVNKKVLFTENSADVVHSFFVPEFLFKRDVIPGRTNSFEVTLTRQGSFVGRCSEFCGTYHSMMNFEVRAVSAGDYDAYIQARQDGMTTAAALQSIGQAPHATTTSPFGNDRGQRDIKGTGGQQ
ncbi:MAG: cytochrome c oxidase subunit II [Mycobacteriales bacterium]